MITSPRVAEFPHKHFPVPYTPPLAIYTIACYTPPLCDRGRGSSWYNFLNESRGSNRELTDDCPSPAKWPIGEIVSIVCITGNGWLFAIRWIVSFLCSTPFLDEGLTTRTTVSGLPNPTDSLRDVRRFV